MKKRIRSILAILLAMTIVMTAGAAVFADGEPVPDTGSITIDNAVNGKTYTIYRIFDLNSHNEAYSALNYNVSAAWTAFFAEGADGLNYVEIDSQGYVTWKKDASASDFAAKAIEFAIKNGVANQGETAAEGGKAKFEGLALGYYLVKSELGALCALDTTMPDVVMKEKNAESTVDKLVKEDSTGIYGKTNDADIGQTVEFETTIAVNDGAPKSYVLHDCMSDGLTFDKTSVKVAIGEKTLTAETDYTLEAENPADGCTFEIHLKDAALKPNDVVRVTYQAKVNENAVVAGTGNPNETFLQYGENKTTEKSTTRTYVWQMEALKFAKDGETDKPLAGAEFILYQTDSTGAARYARLTDGKLAGWTEAKKEATVITTPESGIFSAAGLDADTYYLEEIKAPAGYNVLKDPVKFVIAASVDTTTNEGTATVTYNETATGVVRIENKTGALLPSTGGMGTTLIYCIGGLLAAGAAILLATGRRMRKANNKD